MMSPSPPSALVLSPPPILDRPLLLALIGASGLHLVLILALSFTWPESRPPPESAVEVIVLKELAQVSPHRLGEAALSQRDQMGQSAQGEAAVPAFGESAQADTGPEGTSPPAPPQRPVAGPRTPEGPSGRPDALVVPLSPPQTEAVLSSPLGELAGPQTRPSPAPQTAVDAAQILASQGLEVARLGRESSLTKRQRRRAVTANTREYRYASYLDAWAKKVERIGNLNYPQAAREQGLYGSLVLHVAVRKDGSVEGIRVVRSSGIELLDQAAIQIVELAAPFAPFPPEIAAETDVLDIIRTWQFMRGDVLSWGR